MALPAHSSRGLGLRQPDGAESARHHRRWTSGEGCSPGHQAGVRLHVRSSDRRAGLAHRGAPGADRHRPRRRSHVSHPALPDQAAAVRGAGRPDRGPGGLHPRDPADGARGRRGVQARPALHTAVAARHDLPTAGGRRRQLVGRRRRSRNRRAVRSLLQRPLGDPLPRRTVQDRHALHRRPHRSCWRYHARPLGALGTVRARRPGFLVS